MLLNPVPVHVVSFCTGALAADKGVMLVDLSDTTNWKHTDTGLIVLRDLVIHINADSAFAGTVDLGVLAAVDATNGDLKILKRWPFTEVVASNVIDRLDFSEVGGIPLTLGRWFGPTTANDTTWQTDTNLLGPDGTTAFPAGDGDLVLKVTRTAGDVNVSGTLLYSTMKT